MEESFVDDDDEEYISEMHYYEDFVVRDPNDSTIIASYHGMSELEFELDFDRLEAAGAYDELKFFEAADSQFPGLVGSIVYMGENVDTVRDFAREYARGWRDPEELEEVLGTLTPIETESVYEIINLVDDPLIAKVIIYGHGTKHPNLVGEYLLYNREHNGRDLS